MNNNRSIRLELSAQHLDILDQLATSLDRSRDCLIAHAIVILQLIDKGALVVDYDSLPDDVLEAAIPEKSSRDVGRTSRRSSKSPTASATAKPGLPQGAIDNHVFNDWLKAISCYYRLELEFQIWRCDLDNEFGPDLLKACEPISMHPSRLN